MSPSRFKARLYAQNERRIEFERLEKERLKQEQAAAARAAAVLLGLLAVFAAAETKKPWWKR